jgi:AraC-like DNA-binding protein
MVSRLEFSTKDPERALPLLKEFFPDVRMSNPRGHFSFQLASAETEPLSLIHYHLLSPNSSSGVDMSGTLSFGSVHSGSVALTSDRRQIDTSLPWLFPQQPVEGTWDEVTMTAMTVSVPLLLKFTRAQLSDEAFRLRFTGSTPTDPARARQWVALVRYLRTAYAEDAIVESAIVQANTFGHVASMILATFPNNFHEAAHAHRSNVILPSAVRRATHFMEENAHQPITVEDVASAARLSVRGLQYAFRTSLDTTPTAYLRRVRLAGVHHELQVGDPSRGTSVMATALSWGFTHPGRFARLYRETYGRTPRRTLES